MKLQLINTIIYRVPQFSYKDELKDCWPDFKKSVSISSQDFYALIRDTSYEEIGALPERVQYTIWKYFNRARYRATPYGSFAGSGIIKTDRTSAETLTVCRHQLLHRFIDWPYSDQVRFSFAELVEMDAKVFANSSYYFTDADIRFVNRSEKGYELADVPKIELTINILEFCKEPLPISTIVAALQKKADRSVCLNEIEAMLDDQLLISELSPNIIGQDYFERLGIKPSEKQDQYIIAGRPAVSGNLDQALFKHLPSLINKLQAMLPSYRSPHLDQFTGRFLKKFGDTEVRLMVALDPELGVGYGELDQDMTTDELIGRLKGKKANEETDLHHSTLNLLLPKLVSDMPSVIDLETIEMPSLPDNEPLPNTLSVLCTPANGLILLDHIGGATANALLGRFTLADDQVLELVKYIARTEQGANPGIAFFDVAYTAGGVVDNVNRRRSVYDLQLSLLNYDTSGTPLNLNDLLISVMGNEVIIRSVSKGKRLIPRLATAYNYLLSDLPVFRFFCDLQHQGIHKNLYLRLRDRIPGLSYYPRVQYRNIILSPSGWVITLGDLKTKSEQTAVEDLYIALQEKGIPDFVRTGAGDQTLCFDTRHEPDLMALLRELQKQKSLYLEETLIPANAIVQDTSLKPYLPQLLLSFYHIETIYRGTTPSAIYGDNKSIEKLILPGKEWLYFEVYSHHIRADQLLTGPIASLLNDYRNRIKTWFFIRYSENGDHIRLRLKLSDPAEGQNITAALSALLQEQADSGIVADISIRTYRRETERYGELYMESVEAHFQTDSAFVIALIRYHATPMQKYRLCLSLAATIERSGVLDKEIFSIAIKYNCDQFAAEHGTTPADYKLLNAGYQKFAAEEPINFPGDDIQEAYSTFTDSFIALLRKYLPAERPALFSSVFHMHVNRLFSSEQRTHELVIYYYIRKELKRAVHQKAAK